MSSTSSDRFVNDFDVWSNLRLLTKFSEHDPKSVFLLFERIADALVWLHQLLALSLLLITCLTILTKTLVSKVWRLTVRFFKRGFVSMLGSDVKVWR